MAGTDTPTTTRRGTNRLTPKEIDGWLLRLRTGKLRQDDPATKLTDGDGMYLTLTNAGNAVWRVKYRHADTEKTYSVGPYPEIGLESARKERDRVRAWLREGRDPTQARSVEVAAKVAEGGNTFEVVARDWLQKQRKDWTATHYEKSERALERDVFPELGNKPVAEITAGMVSNVIRGILSRGTVDTARKVRQHIGGVLRLAKANSLCDYQENPADTARAVLPKKSQQTRRPAMLKFAQLGAILRSAETARLSPAVRIAHRLCAFTAVRISNVVTAEWREFHLDDEPPQWVIPRRKMKAQDREHDHKVILGQTIAAELREWKRLKGGKGYVFPSPAGGDHISREAIEKAYRVTLGLRDKHSPHGWRSALSTLARDKGAEQDKSGRVISPAFERDVCELALDHIHDSDVVRAYDRGERLQERIRLMTWWDSQLSSAERGADVVPISRAKA